MYFTIATAGREKQFKDRLSAGLACYRDPDASHRVQNEFHLLIARARLHCG